MHIRICERCEKYTLREMCTCCSMKTINPQPAKFSPEDKYGKYRRMQKKAINDAEKGGS